MNTKTRSIIAAVAAISILLFVVSPTLAQSNQTNQSNQATLAIQLAQASKAYAEQVAAIAQQHGVNVSQGLALISLGDQLLTKAQGEVNSAPAQATQDALGAMRDYHAAVQYLMTQAASLFSGSTEDKIAQFKENIARAQNRTGQMQSLLTKLCSVPGASNSTCADGRSNLASALSDLSQASALLSSPNPDFNAIITLATDAMHHMSAAAEDINNLASAAKAQQAVQYIKTVLEPRITQLQQMAQKANLSSSVLQQVQSLLSNAQSDLDKAVQAFQSGSFNLGAQDAQQAIQLMQQAAQLIQQNAKP